MPSFWIPRKTPSIFEYQFQHDVAHISKMCFHVSSQYYKEDEEEEEKTKQTSFNKNADKFQCL